MREVEPKKSFSLIILGAVVAGFALGLFRVGSLQVFLNSTVFTQAELNICGSSNAAANTLKTLLTNLFTVIIYGGVIGGFALAAYQYVDESFMSGSKGSWSKTFKKMFMMFVIIYGGALAVKMLFGIDVTCTLPVFSQL